MGQPVPQPFKVEKRSSVFRTSHITVETPALFIHICLNFCKTGPGMKKGIIPTCPFLKFATRHMVLSRPALSGSLHIQHKGDCVLFRETSLKLSQTDSSN